MIAAAVLLAVIVAVFLKQPSVIGFNGFYFDTSLVCRYTGRKDLKDEMISIAEEENTALSAFDDNSQLRRIEMGEAYSPEKFPMIHELLRGYSDFESRFGKGVTPFCGTVTRLWKEAAERSEPPDEKTIEKALPDVYNSTDYKDSIPEGAMLDFGSGAKGYFCDRVYELTAKHKDTEEIILSCGSSSLLWSEENRSFTTLVTNPLGENILITTNNAFISTSGGYERYFEADGKEYSHIIDIDSGYPADTDIASVTVILPCESGNGLISDLLSTLVYTDGCEAAEKYSEICSAMFDEYGILIISSDGEIITFGTVRLSGQ